MTDATMIAARERTGKQTAPRARPRLLFVVTEDWYFYSHRLCIARAARDEGYDVMVATRVDAHGERILEEGFELVPLRLRRWSSSLWNDAASLVELARLYRRARPDIVHHVALKPVVFGSLAAWLAGVPRVVNALAGLGYVFASRGIRAAMLRPVMRIALARLLRMARVRVIVQNPDDAAMLRTLGVSDRAIVTIPGSGVDTSQFVPAKEPEGPVIACMVSRMLWHKGVGELVEAAQTLAHELPSLRVWLVGAPDPENPGSVPESRLREWSGSGNVEWLGRRDDVASLWQRAHIAVLPSYYREGVPKALLEAAACAKPLVAYDMPGSREIVVDDETGLLVPVRDTAALARAIRLLAGDAVLRRRLGDAARGRVIERFSEERVVADTLSIYRSLLDDGPLRAAS